MKAIFLVLGVFGTQAFSLTLEQRDKINEISNVECESRKGFKISISDITDDTASLTFTKGWLNGTIIRDKEARKSIDKMLHFGWHSYEANEGKGGYVLVNIFTESIIENNMEEGEGLAILSGLARTDVRGKINCKFSY